MTTICQASLPEHKVAIQGLFEEYLLWVCQRIHEEYQAVFDAESILEHDMENLSIFMPTSGFLFLAYEDGSLAGYACIRTIGDRTAELKRMFVRPDFRRKGIGRLLMHASIQAVSQARYSVLRLDSAGFMTDAHALYRSFNFRDIPPYDGSEIPVEYRQHWVFMELNLSDSGID